MASAPWDTLGHLGTPWEQGVRAPRAPETFEMEGARWPSLRRAERWSAGGAQHRGKKAKEGAAPSSQDLPLDSRSFRTDYLVFGEESRDQKTNETARNWAKKSPEGCLRSASRESTARPAPLTCSREPCSRQTSKPGTSPASVLRRFPPRHPLRPAPLPVSSRNSARHVGSITTARVLLHLPGGLSDGPAFL